MVETKLFMNHLLLVVCVQKAVKYFRAFSAAVVTLHSVYLFEFRTNTAMFIFIAYSHSVISIFAIDAIPCKFKLELLNKRKLKSLS